MKRIIGLMFVLLAIALYHLGLFTVVPGFLNMQLAEAASDTSEGQLKREISETFVTNIEPSWVKETLIVSPDNRRVAYAIKKDDRWAVIIDGDKQKKYVNMMENFPIFSPDSEKVAYVAKKNDKAVVVVDSEEGQPYDNILSGTPIFSPDGERVAYGAIEGEQRFVVIDGKEQKRYDGILAGTPIFSPDGKRVAYGAIEGDKWFVVVDGEKQKEYDALIAIGGGDIVFNKPNNLHYLALKGRSIYLVEERFKIQ